jgi:probable HAF family extracellular repeat protein
MMEQFLIHCSKQMVARMLKYFFTWVVVVAIFAFPGTAHSQVTYSVTDLGSLEANGTSGASDINDLGQIVGNSQVAGIQRGFIWQNGTMSQLANLDTDGTSTVSDINNLGVATGRSTTANGNSKAVIWENGSVIDLGDLVNNDSFSLGGNAINDSKVVVGEASSSSAGRVFRWEAGAMTELSGDGTAGGINNADQVVGFSSSTAMAVLFDINGETNLGDFAGGAEFSVANDINELGQIVGFGEATSGRRAALWRNPSTMIDLGDLSGGADSSNALAINDNGFVVGFSGATGGNRAFLWDAGNGMLDLNSLLDSTGTGWTLERATGINSRGQIVGVGTNSAGQTRGFLLTAVPEPNAAFLLMLVSVVGLNRRHRPC